MHNFLLNNRDDLIARCKAKVALRPKREASAEQLATGVPLFLDQLTRTLEAEDASRPEESMRISGASGGDATALSEVGVTATSHGKELLKLGYSVDQVVHDYGDLCQAITDLAVERDAPFSVQEFRTLNRCLDNAIADAVTEFAAQRDVAVADQQAAGENQRVGFLVHELRNSLHIARLAFAALESGTLPVGGSTGAVLKRSLNSLNVLLTHTLTEVRTVAAGSGRSEVFSVAEFIDDAAKQAEFYAGTTGCTLAFPAVDPLLAIAGNRERLAAALTNLLHNAFKFTHPHTQITLQANSAGERVLIHVRDHCGGLPAGSVERLFAPFAQGADDKRGLGLGLWIARESVMADGGELTARDVPGVGCIFTISLPRRLMDPLA